MSTTELLAPAGSIESLDAAIGEGADAVYLGLRSFNARLRTTNFAWNQFEAATKSLHRMDKKIYVTVNTVFEQREADRMYQFLKYLNGVGPDGIIVQDFGVAQLVRQNFPDLKLHASTQMNVASAKGVNVLSRVGFSRVVLSRELDLEELRSVRMNSSAELEVFIHGALCVSCSGLCMFSSYLGGKSANRGMCTQACRRRYRIGRPEYEETGPDAGDDKEFRKVDSAAFMGAPPVREETDEDGVCDDLDDGASGYFFSPSDLQLADQVPDLVELGITSLKIEGRMKSAEYVGIVVSAYRHLLDNMGADRERAVSEAKAILRNDFARAKTSFHYDGGTPGTWLDPRQSGGTGIPLGKIIAVRGGGESRSALVRPEFSAEPDSTDVSGKTDGTDEAATTEILRGQNPEVGDSARFHKADDSDRKSQKLTFVEADRSGRSDRRGASWIPLPEGFGMGDSVYLIQTRSKSKHYKRVLPNDLTTFRRLPGREPAPSPAYQHFTKEDHEGFPDGIYAAVSRLEDLYVAQSSRPIRCLLSYTRKVAEHLMDDAAPALPFTRKELILVLDPFFPQAEDERLSQEIPLLLEMGYKNFVINNVGHVALFRGTGAHVAAGPYLYTFNGYAYDFVNDLGCATIITPLENSRQNLDRTLERSQHRGTVVTIFAYPALFRIRSSLASLYDFSFFSDGRGESFQLVSTPESSLVLPEKPFSIIDKLPFLKEAGFTKFVVDFSGPPLKKRDYKDVMDAVKTGIPLPNIVRFNWKDGFYSPPEPGAAGRVAPNYKDARYSRPTGGVPGKDAGPYQRGNRVTGGFGHSAGGGGGRSDRGAERPGAGGGERPGTGSSPNWGGKPYTGAGKNRGPKKGGRRPD